MIIANVHWNCQLWKAIRNSSKPKYNRKAQWRELTLTICCSKKKEEKWLLIHNDASDANIECNTIPYHQFMMSLVLFQLNCLNYRLSRAKCKYSVFQKFASTRWQFLAKTQNTIEQNWLFYFENYFAQPKTLNTCSRNHCWITTIHDIGEYHFIMYTFS